MRFNQTSVARIIKKLLSGQDYRQEVVNVINIEFLDFTVSFFKKIVDAKINDEGINLSWYTKYFINNKDLKSDEIAIFAGTNKKQFIIFMEVQVRILF